MNGKRAPIVIPIPPKKLLTPWRNGQSPLPVPIDKSILFKACPIFFQKMKKSKQNGGPTLFRVHRKLSRSLRRLTRTGTQIFFSRIPTEINGRAEDTDWYADSASGISKTVAEKRVTRESDWYQDSAAGIIASLKKRGEETDWYADFVSGISKAVDRSKKNDDSDWYANSAQRVASSFEKRKMDYDQKEAYELNFRRWNYDNMRGESLRETSEKGKALFQFEVKLRNDRVDRWHVPKKFQNRYEHFKSDAERVSVLFLPDGNWSRIKVGTKTWFYPNCFGARPC